MKILPGPNPDRLPAWAVAVAIIVLATVPVLLAHWTARGGRPILLGGSVLAILVNATIIGIIVLLAARWYWPQHTLGVQGEALEAATIALTRLDGEILYWSRGCTDLYGWPAGEAIGNRKHTLLKSRMADARKALAPLDQDRECELAETRRDGSTAHVVERRTVLRRPGGAPIVVLTMFDITERARMETELRQGAERLMLAAEVNNIGVFEWDVTSGIIEWSPGSEQRLGVPPGTMASFAAWEANVPAEDLEGIMATIREVAAARGETFTFKYRFTSPGVAPRELEGTSRCFYDAAGVLTHTIGSVVDVTNRDGRDAELRLQSIIETVPDATIVIDDRGIVRSFSSAAEAMFGWSAAETIGQNVKMLMPRMIAVEHDRYVADYLKTGERKVIGRTRELTARRADGSWFPIELNVGEALIGEERVFTGIVRDVSDRLAGEKRLSDLNAELAHVSRQSAMSELAADLAHELNQPLSATANYLAATRILVENGEQGERVGHLLQLAEEQTQRSGEIIRRLRDFLAKREVEMRPESLADVIRGAVELVLFGAAQFDIKLVYSLAPDADAIFADRIQVQQVFVNLLRNAVEALRSMPDGHPRQITLASRLTDDDMVEIALSDTGPRVPQLVHEQLYERFATTKTGTAMGIGLSISRRIVEAHGGQLKAENGESGGATFRFTLPIVEELDDDTSHPSGR